MWSETKRKKQQIKLAVRFSDECQSPAERSPSSDGPVSTRRPGRYRWLWNLSFWAGFAILMMGSCALLLGYMWPRREIVIDRHESTGLTIMDRDRVNINAVLYLCKLTGLILFSLGGFIFGMSLLLPALFGINTGESPSEEETASLACQPDGVNTDRQERRASITATTGVPVIERVKAIQPRNNDESGEERYPMGNGHLPQGD